MLDKSGDVWYTCNTIKVMGALLFRKPAQAITIGYPFVMNKVPHLWISPALP